MVDSGTRVDVQAAAGKVFPQQNCDSLSTWPKCVPIFFTIINALHIHVFVYTVR